MESLFDSLDSAWPRARAGTTVREHGFTMFVALVGLVAALILNADFDLESFPGRSIGVATLADYSIAARTGLYVRVLVAVVLLTGAMLWLLPALQRRAGRELFDTLNTGALPVALLAYLILWRQFAPTTWQTCAGFIGLIVLVWAADRCGAKTRRSSDLGRDVVWLGTIAWCTGGLVAEFAAPTHVPDLGWWAAGVVGIGGLVLYLVRWLVTRRDDSARSAAASDRFVYGLSALAAVPFACFAYREIFLLLNGRGYTSLQPTTVRAAVFGALAVWVIARCSRAPRHQLADGRLDVERLLGRFVFPWLIVGLAACAHWLPTVQLSDDFFESGNAALSVQQFFDFGRMPFLETFDAHGLSDSLFSFIDRILVGHHEASWQLYSHWGLITAEFAVFHVLRRVLGGSCPAIFACISLPYLTQLFHTTPVHGLYLVFLMMWVLRRTSAVAWSAFFLALVAAFAWRLDIGFAGTIASFATIAVVRVAVADFRLPLRGIVRGAVLAAAVCVVGIGGLFVARGVDPIVWLRDMAHVTNSNQGFGYEQITQVLTQIELWHLYGLPFAMMVLCTWMIARFRGRPELSREKLFVLVASTFLAAFTLANFPRGLVRHSFIEHENAMTSAFTLAVLSFTPAWLLDGVRTKAVLIWFVVISSLLAFTLSLDFAGGVNGRRLSAGTTRYERRVASFANMPPVEASSTPVVRAPVSEFWRVRHLAAISQFVQTQLEPQQTFFDLSSSPLLYFHLRRRSPQWLNHLLLVHDEYMQDRALQEWERWDTPFLLMPPDADLAQADDIHPWGDIDGVEMRLRLYKLFEHAYDEYQPYALVDRWPVWVRKDWMQLAPPRAPEHETVFAWTPNGLEDAPDAIDGAATRIRVGGGAAQSVAVITSGMQSTLYVRVVGESERGGTLSLRWRAQGKVDSDEQTRSMHYPAGANERFYLLPPARGMRTLDDFDLQADSDVRLTRVELLRCVSREATSLPQRAHAGVVSTWGDLARLWGTYDPPAGAGYELVRDVYDSATSLEPSFSMGLDQQTSADCVRGIAVDRAGVRLADLDDAHGVRVGDTIYFDAGEQRTVVSIEDRDIRLSGGVLPVELRGESRILLHPARMSKLPILPHEPRRFRFAPVEPTSLGVYLRIRLRSKDAKKQTVRVDYGTRGEHQGRFVFRAVPDGEFHDYALRLSTQANWATLRNQWIEIAPDVGLVELDRVTIVREVP